MSEPIHIQVETDFIEDQSDADEERFVFAYTITIENHGVLSAKLLNRHWVIRDSNGRTEEVRGEGVIGEQPVIQPGESFSYTSGAILQTDVGTMSGSYHMIDEDGRPFDASIPEFVLSIPRTLH
ncbi:ApaG domain protein [gamma proteobacterium HTCC5015]|nr:ApaG domain protein [gamma proteobacterium HTCC5015]